jgi:hypothetical protein
VTGSKSFICAGLSMEIGSCGSPSPERRRLHPHWGFAAALCQAAWQSAQSVVFSGDEPSRPMTNRLQQLDHTGQ